MINCAHPTHFESTLKGDGAWVQRIRGIRANASKRSHAGLNEALTSMMATRPNSAHNTGRYARSTLI